MKHLAIFYLISKDFFESVLLTILFLTQSVCNTSAAVFCNVSVSVKMYRTIFAFNNLDLQQFSWDVVVGMFLL